MPFKIFHKNRLLKEYRLLHESKQKIDNISIDKETIKKLEDEYRIMNVDANGVKVMIETTGYRIEGKINSEDESEQKITIPYKTVVFTDDDSSVLDKLVTDPQSSRKELEKRNYIIIYPKVGEAILDGTIPLSSDKNPNDFKLINDIVEKSYNKTSNSFKVVEKMSKEDMDFDKLKDIIDERGILSGIEIYKNKKKDIYKYGGVDLDDGSLYAYEGGSVMLSGDSTPKFEKGSLLYFSNATIESLKNIARSGAYPYLFLIPKKEKLGVENFSETSNTISETTTENKDIYNIRDLKNHLMYLVESDEEPSSSSSEKDNFSGTPSDQEQKPSQSSTPPQTGTPPQDEQKPPAFKKKQERPQEEQTPQTEYDMKLVYINGISRSHLNNIIQTKVPVKTIESVIGKEIGDAVKSAAKGISGAVKNVMSKSKGVDMGANVVYGDLAKGVLKKVGDVTKKQGVDKAKAAAEKSGQGFFGSLLGDDDER